MDFHLRRKLCVSNYTLSKRVQTDSIKFSAAVGHFAIQLAHLAGYKVVTTASPRNFELAKSLGADAVFDYRDADVVAKVKQVTGDSVTKALDAISLKESQRISAQVIAPTGGKVVLVLGPEAGATDRKDIQFIRAFRSPSTPLVRGRFSRLWN